MIVAARFITSIALLLIAVTLLWVVVRGVKITHESQALTSTQVYETQVKF